MKTGAFHTGIYPNFLAEAGMTDEDARKKVEQVFETIFFDPEENFCHHTDEDAWCMVDTGNIDARTEGMSYGMMMCVQMDRKDIFDKLWTFSERYMLMDRGPNAGYFRWSVHLDGSSNSEGPAPDGEEYYAMALFMASARWGDGEGSFNYSARAREILRHAVHQHEMVSGGEPMWEPGNAYIRFVPGMKISDPSYHLPHFYELFALKADEEDRAFWKRAAEQSRKYLALSRVPGGGEHRAGQHLVRDGSCAGSGGNPPAGLLRRAGHGRPEGLRAGRKAPERAGHASRGHPGGAGRGFRREPVGTPAAVPGGFREDGAPQGRPEVLRQLPILFLPADADRKLQDLSLRRKSE